MIIEVLLEVDEKGFFVQAIVRFITGAKTSWLVLVAFLVGTALIFTAVPRDESSEAPPVGLPDTTESVQVDQLIDTLPSAEGTSALIVFERPGAELTDDDIAAIQELTTEYVEFSSLDFLPPAQVSDDKTVALITVPMDIVNDIDERADRADQMREIASSIEGVNGYFSGPEGFEVDIAAVFDGADVTLLIFTASVVAILLLVTYRSPFLWLVPLIVVGAADGIVAVTGGRVADSFGITLDPSITGIVSVLVFGAGTNYALLLIARYRDELRLFESRRDAMAKALRQAGPAILASGGTVALALATLLLTSLSGNRGLGFAGAYGIVVAMIAALVVLPAALVLFGRWLFWPLVPTFGQADKMDSSLWAKLGRGVSRRPAVVALLGVVVLSALASGLFGVKTGLSQTERFIDAPDAVVGQELLAEGFAAGAGSPAVVIAAVDDQDAVVDAVSAFDGVESAEAAEATDEIVRINVVLEAAAETPEALDTVRALREALDQVGSGEALVGGIDAQSVDLKEATRADQNLAIPLILGLVFVVLVVLLRSLLAPVLLLLTVVASFFSSVGASWWLFQGVFDFPALDDNVLLLSFLFLVALGVDYNIFLVTRANEESETHGIRKGMIRALAATGGVITSAGILLAAVFAVLGVLPLITLTQIGVIVCVGVLLDTLLVRTVIVPALAFLSGDRFWWPRKPAIVSGRHS